jgi:ornithine carbamoyltransferase
MKHILTLKELTSEEIKHIVGTAIEMKQKPEDYYTSLYKKGLLLLFQKTSTRTNLSFQAGIHQLGGYAVNLDWDKSNFSISPIQYEARYASKNSDVIMARLKKHSDVQELAKFSHVPVINGCCEKYHPCQSLADLMTIYEVKGTFEGVTLTYVGVHNNVANSLVAGCMKVGVKLNLVTPLINDQSWDEELMNEAFASGYVKQMENFAAAVAESDFVYTDTWVDMEFYNDPSYQEEKKARIDLMLPYQINHENLAGYNPYIMHDMPVHPGFEISEEMIESEKSVIYTQAENRMHAQKALLHYLLNEEGTIVSAKEQQIQK